MSSVVQARRERRGMQHCLKLILPQLPSSTSFSLHLQFCLDTYYIRVGASAGHTVGKDLPMLASRNLQGGLDQQGVQGLVSL